MSGVIETKVAAAAQKVFGEAPQSRGEQWSQNESPRITVQGDLGPEGLDQLANQV
jgi:hypothetical protein